MAQLTKGRGSLGATEPALCGIALLWQSLGNPYRAGDQDVPLGWGTEVTGRELLNSCSRNNQGLMGLSASLPWVPAATQQKQATQRPTNGSVCLCVSPVPASLFTVSPTGLLSGVYACPPGVRQTHWLRGSLPDRDRLTLGLLTGPGSVWNLANHPPGMQAKGQDFGLAQGHFCCELPALTLCFSLKSGLAPVSVFSHL